MKELIKSIIKKIPIAFTKNQQYDQQTKLVIKKACNTNSNTIDVGCHKGEVMDIIRATAIKGRHFGFEPIPNMYDNLVKKYEGTNVQIFDIALSAKAGTATFNYVVSNPSYSGLIKRKYDRPTEQDTTITVKVDTLDNVIPKNVKIDFIKIDVEGGEFGVLEGAQELIKRDKPIIIFEHGLGASEFYETTPSKIYNLLKTNDLQISTMKIWLSQKPSFSQEEFEEQFYKRKNYYFIAYP